MAFSNQNGIEEVFGIKTEEIDFFCQQKLYDFTNVFCF